MSTDGGRLVDAASRARPKQSSAYFFISLILDGACGAASAVSILGQQSMSIDRGTS